MACRRAAPVATPSELSQAFVSDRQIPANRRRLLVPSPSRARRCGPFPRFCGARARLTVRRDFLDVKKSLALKGRRNRKPGEEYESAF